MMNADQSPSLVRVCAVDIGTNSVRSIVADVSANNRVEVVEYNGIIARLGEGFGASRRLKPEAIARTVQAVAQFVTRGRELNAARFKLVATSAARDAENGPDLLTTLRTAVGLEPEIVSGVREAELILAGVQVSGLLVDAPALLVDVGGGSTELIVHAPPQSPCLTSINLGAVRLTERCLLSDPPAPDELEHASQAAQRELTHALDPSNTFDVIGLGGTITTMAAMQLGLTRYDAASVHGHRLTLDEIERLLQDAARLTIEQRRTLAGLEPGRADILVGGICIVREIARFTGASSLRVCTTGILHGIVLAAAAS